MSLCLLWQEVLIHSGRKKVLLVTCYFKYHVLMILTLTDVHMQGWNELFLSQKYTFLLIFCAEDKDIK